MKKIWILVHVERGFIQEPEFFLNKKAAITRKREILIALNPDYDEVEIFEKTLAV